jgi:hypothetical protein
MKADKVENKFLKSSYRNFKTVNVELNNLFIDIQKLGKDNYFAYSASKSEWVKLNEKEFFLKEIHDKHILAILNIAIYNAIISENYEILYNGIYTYNRLRTLNRLHLSGHAFHTVIESLIYNDNLVQQNTLAEDLLKTFMEFFDLSNGKFDTELIQLLESQIRGENDVEIHYHNLLKLHSRCQWLTKGWYRECNLINYMPVFLVGVYKLINRPFSIETDNKWLIDFIRYLGQNKFKENNLIYTFSGKIDFLNSILNEKYDEFCEEYKSKMHCC